MTTSIDSSAFVPVYVPERFSKPARAAVHAAAQVPFTQLHQLEVRNTFELPVGRRLISRDEGRAILEQLQEDLDAERLMALSLDLDGVFTRASDLSKLYTVKFLARSLDLLRRGGTRRVLHYVRLGGRSPVGGRESKWPEDRGHQAPCSTACTVANRDRRTVSFTSSS